ncbi:MAG: hypothetical protein ACR2KG_01940 [Nocardioidaceae bacterium]
MANRLYLHIGTPKSGTTYLQDVLATNKQALATEARLLFPGISWQDQVLAVRELREGKTADEPRVEGAWQRLVDEIDSWQGDAVVSMEWLGSARPEQVRRAIQSFPSTEVSAIITARSLARIVPAAWQECCQNQRTCTWEDFLTAIAGEQGATAGAGRQFWRQQNLTRVLDTWLAVLPRSRVRVVTVPDSLGEPSLLWARFCEAIDLKEPDRYASTNAPANPSLGLQSSELMRRVNEVINASGIDPRVYERVFKRGLAKQTLSTRRTVERSPIIPVRYHSWLSERSRSMVSEIVRREVSVIGDLADLAVIRDPAAAGADDSNNDVTAEEVLEVALAGFIELVRRQDDENYQLREELGRRGSQHASGVLGQRVRTLIAARTPLSLVAWPGPAGRSPRRKADNGR